jgi:hypothetical protein
MLAKIGLTALVILVVLVISLRSARRRKAVPAKRPPPLQPLLRCPRCGTYHVAGMSCDCGNGPTPRN